MHCSAIASPSPTTCSGCRTARARRSPSAKGGGGKAGRRRRPRCSATSTPSPSCCKRARRPTPSRRAAAMRSACSLRASRSAGRLSQAKAKLELLLLDEPVGAQDPPAHLRLMESLLSWLREERGRTSVLVSHSPAVDLGLSHLAGVPSIEWAFEGGPQ